MTRYIVVIVKQPGFLRYSLAQIEALCERGHRVHIGVQRWPFGDEDGILERLTSKWNTVTVGYAPVRHDNWGRLAGEIRGALDYSHYLFPDYDTAPLLRSRAASHSGRIGRLYFRICRAVGLGKTALTSRIAIGLLRLLEQALPTDPDIMTYLRELSPDLVLLTGLVWPRSPQADYVKACSELGLRCGYAVNSWDNLTNKGDLKIKPDHVFVWNEQQKHELARLHGITPDRVFVTGAALFDKWFQRNPGLTRDEFYLQVGLPPSQPYLLYLCSSPAIASGTREVEFVRRWLAALRRCGHPALAGMSVMIRPHPAHAAQWENAAFDDPTVVVYPRASRWVVSEDDNADYFHSLYYCSAVAGINTSAMIEAAIVGARTFTLMVPEFAETQVGTLHFHYLTRIGIVVPHTTFEDHFKAMATELRAPNAPRKPNPGVFEFVRPLGAETKAARFAADAIEQACALGAKSRPMTNPAAVVLHAVMWPLTFRLGLRNGRKKAAAKT